MVAMLFQKFCASFPEMKAEIMTALSAEEAVRLSMTHNYHIITMDETLSASYCTTVKEQQANVMADDSRDLLPDLEATLHIDANRNETAKRRNDFFQKEIFNHRVLDGDGTLAGHMAMKQIIDIFVQEEREERPIVLNLTGNVMDVDRQLYITAGSSGVLPKPTKLDDLTFLLQRQLGDLLNKGLCKLSEGGYITTIDGTFTYAKANGDMENLLRDGGASASSLASVSSSSLASSSNSLSSAVVSSASSSSASSSSVSSAASRYQALRGTDGRQVFLESAGDQIPEPMMHPIKPKHP
jgi:CheY-like chemotaxis protein